MTNEDIEIVEQDEPYDASDSKRVNTARKRAARIRQDRLNFVREMMGSKNGRLWVFDLLEACKIFGNPLQPGQSDVTFFNIGQQNIGKLLLQDINEAAPEMYMQMLTEGREEK